MNKVEDLTSLVFNAQKLWIPYDESKRNKGYYIFTLNTPIENIATLLNNEHPKISNNGSLYKAYYYDYLSLPRCIKSKKVVNSGLTKAKAKQERLQYYNQIETSVGEIKTPINLNSLAGKNFVYDLNPVTELYDKQSKLKTSTLVVRLKTFFDTISGFTSKTFSDYKCGGIFVDLDAYKEWKNKESHILYNLLMLMKRSNKIIDSMNIYDFKIIFYSKNGYFMFDMKTDLVKTNYSKLIRAIKRLGVSVNIEKEVDEAEKDEIAKVIAKKTMVSALTGDDISSMDAILPDDILDKEDPEDESSEDNNEMNETLDEVFQDEELKKEYNEIVISKNEGKRSEANLKRDEMLREKQKNIVVSGKTVEQITKDKTIAPVKPHKVEIDTVTNTELKEMKFSEINKTYMETTYQKDIVNMIMSLNDASIPVNILDIKVEDTSDSLNYKETYTVTMESSDRTRHTMTFDLPKFIDDKYLYVNGNKKVIQSQFFAYPIVKTGPDEVQICTNYNKIFINRVGSKFSANSEKLKKMISDPKYTISVHNGCNTELNKNYLTCIEYDELAKSYNVINIGNATFMFNAKALEEVFDGKEKSTLDKILIGYTIDKGNKKTPIYYDQTDPDHVDLISVMMSYHSQEVQDEFMKMSNPKKLVHTKATIMARDIPVIILLGFFEGLDKVLRKFNKSTVKFSDKKTDKNYQYIKFSDGYLCYPMSDMEACMLFNGLNQIPTGAYSIEDMSRRETYLDIFEYMFGSSYIAGALINYYDFMIDPITLEVLQLLDYPTDITSLMIFASNMLADNDFKSDMDLNQYRMRRNEVVAAILYKNIVRSYSRYRQTSNNPNPIKITMDKSAVIKELMALPTIEDYSTLSPMVELHKDGLVSMKGANGMNMDRAYKLDKRAYDDSMIGVVGMSTDNGPNAGKIRQLVAEPKVVNVRGFMDMTKMEDCEKLNNTNLVTPIEMLTPMTSTHDSPERNAMTTKQTCHVIPVKNNCPVLISTGMDQIAHYRTGGDFSVVAKDNGKVIEYNEKAQLMVIEYKDKTTQAIDLSPHVVKNGAGGFYLANQLVAKVKLNQTFKKDDILAYDPKYYKEQSVFGNRMTMGSMMKTAIISNFSTYEDSSFVTKKMSEDMSSDITMQKHLILGANSSVDYIVKPGQEITIGDDLIRYETSYDDKELNDLLSNVRDDMKEEIINLGKSKMTSSYTGRVEDVIIYSGVELEELSPSLRKIVSAYQNTIKDKEKTLDKYSKDNKGSCYRMGVVMDKPYSKVEADQFGKIKGYDVGKGVLIEFYISYHDELSDGDKLAAFTANKNTIGYVVPRGFEAYSEFRPYEEISSPVAPSAILQRGTPSVVTTGCCYKVLIEMKRKLYEVLTGENYDEILKEYTDFAYTENINDILDIKPSVILKDII